VPWLTYLCAGLVIGRLPRSSLRVATGLIAVGMVAALAATLASLILLYPLGGLAAITAATRRGELEGYRSVADYLALAPEGTTPTTRWWLAVDAPHASTSDQGVEPSHHPPGAIRIIVGGRPQLVSPQHQPRPVQRPRHDSRSRPAPSGPPTPTLAATVGGSRRPRPRTRPRPDGSGRTTAWNLGSAV
jgi:hypothetical protein